METNLSFIPTDKKEFIFLIGKNIRRRKIQKKKIKFFNFTIFKYIIICIILLLNLFIVLENINVKSFFYLNYNKKNYKIVGISYSNKLYKASQLLNKKTAYKVGKVDEYYSYGPNDIDNTFKEKNKDILSRERGNGYWLWKPYFILKTLKEKLNNGDFLIYTDAQIIYTDRVDKLIDFLKERKAEMWAERLACCIEKEYSKRDAFVLIGVDQPFYTNTNQYIASYQIYKKTILTEKFLEDYLYYCRDKRIITDEPNSMGLPNYNIFIDNRHDQTVFSLLIKKYGLANSGSQNMSIDEINKLNTTMPHIFCHYRREWFKDYEDLKRICKIKNY